MLTGTAVPLRVALSALLMVVTGTAGAQLRTDPSSWGAGQDGIRLSAPGVVDLTTRAPDAPDPTARRRGLFSSLGLYEYRPVGAAPGQYVRPHYALGLHSVPMQQALAMTGLDADTCIAPIVRLRARPSTATAAGGLGFTLIARCTFH